MDVFISFFRDVLDGPVYIVVAIISVIFICAGIGYFAERKQKREDEEKNFEDTHVKVKSIQENNQNQNITTGGQKTTISNVSTANNQYGIPGNIPRGKVESKVVPEVINQTKPVTNTQQPTYQNSNINNQNNTAYQNQNAVYQNNQQINNSTYNVQSSVAVNNNYANNSNTNQNNYYSQNQTYNNQNQNINNSNINNNFTN